MTSGHLLGSAVFIAAAALGASRASAQPLPQPAAEPVQPIQELPVAETAPRTPTFAITADVFGARDAAVGEAPLGLPSPEGQTYWGGNLATSFERPGRRVDLTGTAGTSVRRYGETGGGFLPSYNGSLRLQAPVGRRGSFGVGQSLSYGPMNVLSFFESGPSVQSLDLAPLVDYRVAGVDQFVSETRADYSHQVSRHGSLSGAVGFGLGEASDVEGGVNTQSFRRWDVSMRYTYQASRYANWYLGYGLVQGIRNGEDRLGTPIDDETGAPELVPSRTASEPRLHNIDVGIGYDRPLSFSRRTRVSFQVGGAVAQGTEDISGEIRAVGSAGIRHEIGRTWLAQATFSRSTHFVPLFPEPLLSDGATVGLTGFLTRTASLNVLLNYATGTIGVEALNRDYRAGTASASVRQAIAERMAIYAEYFYFDANFGDGVALADVLLTRVRRHGIRVGVSFGTNLIGRGRRPSAPAGVGGR